MGSYSTQSSVALVLFPGAGEGPSFFRGWNTSTPRDWAVLGVNLPGRGIRYSEPFAEDLTNVVAEISAALAGLAHSELIFFGHSLGGVLATEVAICLPEPPKLLITAGCPVPINRPGSLDEGDPGQVRELLREIAPELTGQVLDEMVEIVTPICRADMALFEGHRCSAKALACDVVSIYAEEDSTPHDAWQEMTTCHAEAIVVPGGHFGLGNSARDIAIAHAQKALG